MKDGNVPSRLQQPLQCFFNLCGAVLARCFHNHGGRQGFKHGLRPGNVCGIAVGERKAVQGAYSVEAEGGEDDLSGLGARAAIQQPMAAAFSHQYGAAFTDIKYDQRGRLPPEKADLPVAAG